MASKRLIKELSAYRRDGSPALTRLEPKSDDDLFNWTADLQGPEGTPYEGNPTHSSVIRRRTPTDMLSQEESGPSRSQSRKPIPIHHPP